MPIENGERYEPLRPDLRGRHATFGSAVDAALANLARVRSPFFDALADNWRRLFPHEPAWPGRYEDGIVFLYVRTYPTVFVMRPRLKAIRSELMKLPMAPKTLKLRLEVHA